MTGICVIHFWQEKTELWIQFLQWHHLNLRIQNDNCIYLLLSFDWAELRLMIPQMSFWLIKLVHKVANVMLPIGYWFKWTGEGEKKLWHPGFFFKFDGKTVFLLCNLNSQDFIAISSCLARAAVLKTRWKTSCLSCSDRMSTVSLRASCCYPRPVSPR